MNTPTLTDRTLQTIDETDVGVFAFRDGKGRPMAWPVTPYLDGGDGRKLVVTSTLAYIRKAQHVRRDGRVALLAGGVHVSGDAQVTVDTGGDIFTARFLEQELRKYPPARQIVNIPLHRQLFSWYFGRVFMTFESQTVHEMLGDDGCTLVTFDDAGYPRITPIEQPPNGADAFTPEPLDATAGSFADGAATVLYHLEPTMADLRQKLLRGEMRGGEYVVQSRNGSLAAPRSTGWLGELRNQIALYRQGRKSRKVVQDWEPAAGVNSHG